MPTPKSLINSFKILCVGKEIKPTTHVSRVLFTKQEMADGEKRELVSHDVTDILQACGLTEEELMEPWLRKSDSADKKKSWKCQDPRLAKFAYKDSGG